MSYADRITALPLPEMTVGYNDFASGFAAACNASSEIAAEADAELTALRERVAELERAGQAVVDRWETPLWKDARHTADFIHDLRAAINKGKL